MKCKFCNKSATVHLSQIVENKVHKIDLCEECAKAKGVDDPVGYSLTDLLAGLGTGKDSSPDEVVIHCPTCNYSQRDFKKSGRLGCPDCYDVFAGNMDEMLRGMHKGTCHKGKAPAQIARSLNVSAKLDSMQRELDASIQREDFERAATLRDEIKQLKEANSDLIPQKA